MGCNSTQLRGFMGLTNVPSISDEQLTGSISDSSTVQETRGITDDLAIKYYAAFLLSKSVDWNTLSKNSDVSFNKPNPDTYNDMYKERVNDLYTSTIDVSG